MVGTYRKTVVGNSAYRAEGTPSNREIQVDIQYPYTSQSGSMYSNGVVKITDTLPPFTTSEVPLTVLPADYQGPRNILSSQWFPMHNKATSMTLTDGATFFYIVVPDEPRWKNGTETYYTYTGSPATPTVDTILSSALVDDKYLMYMLDKSLQYLTTGPLIYYGFFALLQYLESHLDKTDNALISHSAPSGLLDVYMNNRELLYEGDADGVWRLLPDEQLIESLEVVLPSFDLGEDGQTKILDFLVAEVYKPLAVSWRNIMGDITHATRNYL